MKRGYSAEVKSEALALIDQGLPRLAVAAGKTGAATDDAGLITRASADGSLSCALALGAAGLSADFTQQRGRAVAPADPVTEAA